MKTIGKANNNDRQILYVSTKDMNWFNQLPDSNWIAFIVCDSDNTDFMIDLTVKCMNKNVGYVCTAGKYCEKLHDVFDEEITSRVVEIEGKTGKEDDYEDTPMTTWHYNFAEGLWFAMLTAYDGDKEFDKIVCIDCTDRGVEKHILYLINKINHSRIPSDEEIEDPLYDN